MDFRFRILHSEGNQSYRIRYQQMQDEPTGGFHYLICIIDWNAVGAKGRPAEMIPASGNKSENNMT